MLIPNDIKIHLYCGITDMRKSINTLAIMVQEVLQMELQFDEAEAVLPEELPQEDNTITVTYSRNKPNAAHYLLIYPVKLSNMTFLNTINNALAALVSNVLAKKSLNN